MVTFVIYLLFWFLI